MKKVKFNFISYVFQLIAGGIFLVAAFPKISGAPESLVLFNQLNIEGSRLVVGGLELLAALFLIFNYLPQIGALIGFCVMLGALLAHITTLGIIVNGDGGVLFGLLFAAMTSTILVMWFNRERLPLIGHTFKKNK